MSHEAVQYGVAMNMRSDRVKEMRMDVYSSVVVQYMLSVRIFNTFVPFTKALFTPSLVGKNVTVCIDRQIWQKHSNCA